MTDQTRLDRLNQGLDKLDSRGKEYIERLTSRLLQRKPPDPAAGPAQTTKTTAPPKKVRPECLPPLH